MIRKHQCHCVLCGRDEQWDWAGPGHLRTAVAWAARQNAKEGHMNTITCPCCQSRFERLPYVYIVKCPYCKCCWSEASRIPPPTRTIRCPNLRGFAPQTCPPDCPECHGTGTITVGIV